MGSELLAGQINTHQGYIAQKLPAFGLRLTRESSLPDDERVLADALRAALRRADAVIVCGGLGPTFDDLTREACARALGRELVFKPAVWRAILARFRRHGYRDVPEENKRQAFAVDGARVLRNDHGSAPGQLLTHRGRTIALLPGPYGEMAPLLERDVLPALRRAHGRGVHVARLVVRTAGVPESVIDERLAQVTAQAGPELEFTILSGIGGVSYHATAYARTKKAARARVATIRERVYAAVGDSIFGEDGATLESALGAALRAKGLKVAAAESCTGGLLGQRLTAQAGSSDYFAGGVVAYANEVKRALLGVPADVLERRGAVSRECALAMAEGARRALSADLGVAITGVAGPGGGTPQKPVGLVWIAVAGEGGTLAKELRLLGGREQIRERSATAALNLLRDFVK